MIKKKYILGIETSCDETAVSVVKNGRIVLSSIIKSSVFLHQDSGGVIPEIASRAQERFILETIKEALKKAFVSIEKIDLIAVTNGPGLVGSLLVGVSVANLLALIYQKPVVGVPHIWGHMYANFLDHQEKINFPALVLTVSGGHNDLYLWKDYQKFEKLGASIDDAAGEAFDKCGRMIGLSYPAGKTINELAKKGDSLKYKLPRPLKNSKDYNFSFSGLKTAFLYLIEKEDLRKKQNIFDLCASLELAIVDSLFIKLKKAIKNNPEIKEIHLSGGVSANTKLREIVENYLSKFYPHLVLRYPKKISYCTDNGAMIASCAFFCDFLEEYVELQ
jgi:N6-L-threonylcarbamoyladenine synthase